MSSQALKGLALLVAGLLLTCLADVGIVSYALIGWGGLLFMRGLPESGEE